MKGVDEPADAAVSEVIDLDAAIAQRKESQSSEAGKTQTETKPDASVGDGKTEEGKEKESKEKAQSLNKVETKADTSAEKPAETGKVEKDQEQADDEYANPDQVVFDVNGKDVSATEIFRRYEDATAELEAYKGIEKDEWLKKFVDYRLKGGDPLAYLQTQTRDWTKVGELDLLKQAFLESEDAEGLDSEAKEELFARHLSEKYGSSIDGTYEEENSKSAKVGKQLMRRDAEKVRTAKLEQQKNFGLPKSDDTKQVQQVVDPAKERESLLKNAEVKNFVESKMVRIGDTDFGHEVEDPESVIEMMVDTRNFWRLFAQEGGGTDWDRLQKTMAFAMDPSKYDATVLLLGKNLGEEKYLKEKKNIKTAKEENQDKAADTGGFNKIEFLKALKQQHPNW